MTTQELKQQIDKVLGNSIRCLLPSYWWKRLFNLVTDKVEEVDNSVSVLTNKVEETVSALANKVDEAVELSKEGNSIIFYIPLLGELSESAIAYNSKSYSQVLKISAEGKACDIKISIATTDNSTRLTFNANDVDILTTNREKIVLRYNIDNSHYRLSVSSDGNITNEEVEDSKAEIREVYIYEHPNNNITELDYSQKSYNKETLELARQGKAIIRAAYDGMYVLFELFADNSAFVHIHNTMYGNRVFYISIDDEGLATMIIEDNYHDNTLSTTSSNAVQNKVITEALNNKVDKSEGKQLSTEDFTTVLKTKLEGLNNFDSTEIENSINSIQTQLNTLVSGNASDAINSFNEIIAFLNGVKDTEDLEGIIASIEQQIASKQDNLISGTNIKTINGESIVGSGDITISGDGVQFVNPELKIAEANGFLGDDDMIYALPNSSIIESENYDKILATRDDIGYTTEFSVADIEAVYGRGITKPVNVQGLISAIEANKPIIIPTNITDASNVGGNAVTMAKMDNDGFIYLNVIVPYLDGVHKEYFIQIKITTAQLIKSGSNGSITLKELVARETLEEVEEVWATTYNKLNTKISEVQQYIYDEAASRKQFDEAIAEIQAIIAENESVVTAAWNQLNTRINALEAAQIS